VSLPDSTQLRRYPLWLFVVLEPGEDLVGVAFWFNFAPDIGYFAVWADKESGALDAHYFFAVHILLFQNIKELGDGFIGVG
jgi:hypothetical protein